jgi:hypothetical protein
MQRNTMRKFRVAPPVAVICIALRAVTVPATFAQPASDFIRGFDAADRLIMRLSPTAFPELPGNVAGELVRRGCTIPQDSFTKKPHNVIRGAFAKPGQTDWAVLCSVKGVSTILVFWNGSEKDAAAISKLEDRTFLQATAIVPGFTLLADERLGFSRRISPVPLNDHLGIDDASVLKTSLWYFYAGGWLKLY